MANLLLEMDLLMNRVGDGDESGGEVDAGAGGDGGIEGRMKK